jgi:hypothetical protein
MFQGEGIPSVERLGIGISILWFLFISLPTYASFIYSASRCFTRSRAHTTAKSANFDKQKLEDSIKVIDCGSAMASPLLAAPSEGLADVVLKIQCNAPNAIAFS